MRHVLLATTLAGMVPFFFACSAAGPGDGGIAGGGAGSVQGSGSATGSGGGLNVGGASGAGGTVGASGAAGTPSGSSGAAGVTGCNGSGNNGWTSSGNGTAEICGNGLDDNLDGFVDEGCTCAIGATQPCYGGPPPLAGIGACLKGTQTCSGKEFGNWGPCTGWVAPSVEVCEGSVDENCNGQLDESCGCCEGATQPCGVQQGVCTPGTQTCVNGAWSDCTGGVMPGTEICGNGLDDDCDGQVDEGCTLNVPVNIDGDCVTASCPPQAPYAVGCTINMAGGDSRGCVANDGGPIVYFQEGDKCGAGKVTGVLYCSSQPGAPLGPANCPINKSTKYYPTNKSGCPATS